MVLELGGLESYHRDPVLEVELFETIGIKTPPDP